MSQQTAMQQFLAGWFRKQLDQANADFSREPLSYDGNSEYDRLCYSLVAEAERLCRLRFGTAPSGCELQRALAAAEFGRSRRDRLAQPWWKKGMKKLLSRLRSTRK